MSLLVLARFGAAALGLIFLDRSDDDDTGRHTDDKDQRRSGEGEDRCEILIVIITSSVEDFYSCVVEDGWGVIRDFDPDEDELVVELSSFRDADDGTARPADETVTETMERTQQDDGSYSSTLGLQYEDTNLRGSGREVYVSYGIISNKAFSIDDISFQGVGVEADS